MCYYEMDALGRTTRRNYAGAYSVYHEYDANSNRTAMNDRQGRWTFAFDALDRVTEREAPGGKTFGWAYDEVSNQVRQTDADDGHTYHDYDANNRLSVIRDLFGGSFYFQYDAAGRLVSKQLPSGAVTYQGYDEAGRVSQVLHAKSDNTVLASYDTTCDSRGNPTRITDQNGDYREFQYDSLSRLIAEKWYDVGDTLLDRKVYFYDAAYNRIREDFEGGPTVYYLYDARNAPTEIKDTDGNVTYLEYNAAGSLASETTDAGTAYYEWNAEEMLQRVDLAAGGNAYYDYDGDARRWSKQDSEGVKRYHWDATRGGEPGLAVVQEADGGGTTTGSYTHDQGATIMPGVGTLLSVREDSTDHFFHTDAQGTTRLLTDADEATAATYDLDAWGVQRSHTGAFSTPYLFTGKERDANTSLDYFLARQYRPQWGAFIASDLTHAGHRRMGAMPLGALGVSLASGAPSAQTALAYVYCWNRVLACVDPDGLWGGDVHQDMTEYLGWIVRVPFGRGGRCWKVLQRPLGPHRVGKADALTDDMPWIQLHDGVWAPGSSWHFSHWDYPDKQRGCNVHAPKEDREHTWAWEYDLAMRADQARDCHESYIHLGHALHALQDEDAHGRATPCEHVDASNYWWIDDAAWDTKWDVLSTGPFADPGDWLKARAAWVASCPGLEFIRTFDRRRGTSRYDKTYQRTKRWLTAYLTFASYCFTVVDEHYMIVATIGALAPPR